MDTPSEPREFFVYAQRFDRLTSRLEGLIGAWRFARALHRNLFYFWPTPNGCRAEDYLASSILDLRAMARSPESSDLKVVERRCGLRRDFLDLASQPGWPYALDFKSLQAWKADFYFHEEWYPEFKGEDRVEIEIERKKLFALLRPHPVILENLGKAVDWLGTGPFTAVHIRRGDVMTKLSETLAQYRQQTSSGATADPVPAVEERLRAWVGHFVKRAAPVEAYLEGVGHRTKGHPPSGRLLVFSDSDSAAREFQQKLPEREVILASAFQTSLTEIQRSWLEVLLMMRARKIIATNSTFSDFASRYGGIPLLDVRSLVTKKKIRAFFLQSFASELGDSPAFRKKCVGLLGRALRQAALERYWLAACRICNRARSGLRSKRTFG